MSWKAFRKLPETIKIRECRVSIARRGFRSKVLILATTLLDPKQHPKEELAELYLTRWNAELDLRSLKTTLRMDVLRCKTPEQVRKELWTNVIAYNLIRTVMAQAADEHDMTPRTISFRGTTQILQAFQPLIALRCQRDAKLRNETYKSLLEAIAFHRVGNRPGRFEPRHLKRRKKKYPLLMKPRRVLQAQMARGVIVN